MNGIKLFRFSTNKSLVKGDNIYKVTLPEDATDIIALSARYNNIPLPCIGLRGEDWKLDVVSSFSTNTKEFTLTITATGVWSGNYPLSGIIFYI